MLESLLFVKFLRELSRNLVHRSQCWTQVQLQMCAYPREIRNEHRITISFVGEKDLYLFLRVWQHYQRYNSHVCLPHMTRFATSHFLRAFSFSKNSRTPLRQRNKSSLSAVHSRSNYQASGLKREITGRTRKIKQIKDNAGTSRRRCSWMVAGGTNDFLLSGETEITAVWRQGRTVERWGHEDSIKG